MTLAPRDRCIFCFVLQRLRLKSSEPENLSRDDLVVRLGPEADEDEGDERDEVDEERGPVGQAEGDPESSAEHDVDAARSKNGADHHHQLKYMNNGQRNILIVLAAVATQQ